MILFLIQVSFLVLISDPLGISIDGVSGADSCPKLTSIQLEGPITEKRMTKFQQAYLDFYFVCNIKWSTLDTLEKEQFDVVFTFDGQEVDSVAPKTTDGSNLTVKLWSKELAGQMGKRIGVKVTPYWKGSDKSNCKFLQIKSAYFLGFNYSTENKVGTFTNPKVVIPRNSPVTLYFRPTVPISCPETDQQTNCTFSVTVADMQKDVPVGVSSCNMNFGGLQSGSMMQTLNIKAKPTSPNALKQSTEIQFNPIKTTEESIWNDLTFPPIDITVTEVEPKPTSSCSSTGDPHITTFDKRYFHSYVEGDFVLAKSTLRNFEVQVRQTKCWAVACNCAVAVREGNNVLGINVCLAPHSPKPITYLRDPSVPGATITGCCNQYKITMPSGAYVTVYKWGFLNIVVYLNKEDFNKTSGLCGNNNGVISDDIVPSPRSSQMYRLKPEESFLNGHIYPIKCVDTETTQSKFCSCEDGKLVACETGNVNSSTGTETYETKYTRNCGAGGSPGGGEGGGYPDSHRVLIITETDIPLPEIDVNHGVNVTLRWPTASGITEVGAKAKCQAKMETSPVYQPCKDRIATNIEALMTSCVTDLQITDDATVATSYIANEFQTICVTVLQNLVAINGTTDASLNQVLTKVMSMICINQCNGQGTCHNGTCVCNDGFAGEDCSVNATDPPRLISIRNGSLCDFRTSFCSRISISAENFYKSPNLTCKVSVFGLTREFIYNGSVLSTGEVICPVPDVSIFINKNASTGGEPAPDVSPAPIYKWIIQLTNDGNLYSNWIYLTVYDSKCMMCGPDGICNQKPETCVINGICYISSSPAGACGVCNASRLP